MAQAQRKQRPMQPNDRETEVQPRPQDRMENYQATGKLKGCRALITGGDSGIGRAVAIGCAMEGADIAIVYNENDDDAQEIRRCVEKEGRTCCLIRGDVGDVNFCREAVQKTVETLGGLDILVNNAGEQHPQDSLEDITPEQMERTFRTNFFGTFYMTQAALEHLEEGSSIINTTSITSFQGHPKLLDYSATKGALTTFKIKENASVIVKMYLSEPLARIIENKYKNEKDTLLRSARFLPPNGSIPIGTENELAELYVRKLASSRER